MSRSFILIRCDRSLVGDLRRAVHYVAAQTADADESDIVFHPGSGPVWMNPDVYDAYYRELGTVMETTLKSGRSYAENRPLCAHYISCSSCGKVAMTFCQRPGALVRLLKRWNWGTHWRNIVCPNCVVVGDQPISLFSKNTRLAFSAACAAELSGERQ